MVIEKPGDNLKPSRAHLRIIVMFTFQISIFFFYPSLFHSFALLCPLHWNSGVIFIYRSLCWQNGELGRCVPCRWCKTLRCEKAQCTMCYTTKLQINKHASPGCTEFAAWGVSEARLCGRICPGGCWRQQGDLVPRRCDAEAQQQVLVPGPGSLLPCSPEPGSCTDLPAVTPKGGKHLWRHHGKGDGGAPGTGGRGGQGVREGSGVCCRYQSVLPPNPDLTHHSPHKKMGKECRKSH